MDVCSLSKNNQGMVTEIQFSKFSSLLLSLFYKLQHILSHVNKITWASCRKSNFLLSYFPFWLLPFLSSINTLSILYFFILLIITRSFSIYVTFCRPYKPHFISFLPRKSQVNISIYYWSFLFIFSSMSLFLLLWLITLVMIFFCHFSYGKTRMNLRIMENVVCVYDDDKGSEGVFLEFEIFKNNF
mgnify:FL=1